MPRKLLPELKRNKSYIRCFALVGEVTDPVKNKDPCLRIANRTENKRESRPDIFQNDAELNRHKKESHAKKRMNEEDYAAERVVSCDQCGIMVKVSQTIFHLLLSVWFIGIHNYLGSWCGRKLLLSLKCL